MVKTSNRQAPREKNTRKILHIKHTPSIVCTLNSVVTFAAVAVVAEVAVHQVVAAAAFVLGHLVAVAVLAVHRMDSMRSLAVCSTPPKRQSNLVGWLLFVLSDQLC